jgi:hypothetical protein
MSTVGILQPLTVPEEKCLRALLYDEKIVLHSLGELEIDQAVKIPAKLNELFASKPVACTHLLTKVAEGASPYHSMVSLAYLLSFAKTPRIATVVVENFNADTYDDLQSSWGCTTRQHWLNKLSEKK